MTLTIQGFESLLKSLDPDTGRAGERYELIRRKLVRFFEWHRGGPAEDRADEVIDRVVRRLERGETIRADDPTGYFFGVARNVLREHWDSQKRERRALSAVEAAARETAEEAIPEGAEDERASECLQLCLGRLAPDRRRLVLRYYQGEKAAKIRARQELAEALGIPQPALRLRVFRIRENLERCVRACLHVGAAEEAPARARGNGLRAVPTPEVKRGAP